MPSFVPAVPASGASIAQFALISVARKRRKTQGNSRNLPVSAIRQFRFCKPSVGGSSPSTGTIDAILSGPDRWVTVCT